MANLIEMKLKLPTGREAALVEGLRFCYDLSETDALILFELLKGGQYTVDDLTKKLGLSKATVNRSLAKLMEAGFVSRSREKRAGVGRPRYKYYIEDPEKVINKIIDDFDKCSQSFREALTELLRSIRAQRGQK
ncbi:TrmB family transcriptional regulator [Pyrodictium occultum]|uniref:TrmB family transcriptional regulator n=1 Tax=Pyrodictium occultum TaxID=2309 RepID=A0A0V8RXG5_PYROC|nr:HTH-type transcriptional regulator Lrs14 [Pyrodictium occultum]KSW12752.1 TrmB family transcriptional regulator [Pyrodictium occultum]